MNRNDDIMEKWRLHFQNEQKVSTTKDKSKADDQKGTG